ncbi:MAG: Integrase core domain-containing protein [Glomeribacter sp. 1016415]|nr:Integrase core domain-containing protein [Glomeribacter sp. 1016415]
MRSRLIHLIEGWRQDYNSDRPHSAFAYYTPTEFAAIYQLNPRILIRYVANYGEQVKQLNHQI